MVIKKILEKLLKEKLLKKIGFKKREDSILQLVEDEILVQFEHQLNSLTTRNSMTFNTYYKVTFTEYIYQQIAPHVQQLITDLAIDMINKTNKSLKDHRSKNSQFRFFRYYDHIQLGLSFVPKENEYFKTIIEEGERNGAIFKEDGSAWKDEKPYLDIKVVSASYPPTLSSKFNNTISATQRNTGDQTIRPLEPELLKNIQQLDDHTVEYKIYTTPDGYLSESEVSKNQDTNRPIAYLTASPGTTFVGQPQGKYQMCSSRLTISGTNGNPSVDSDTDDLRIQNDGLFCPHVQIDHQNDNTFTIMALKKSDVKVNGKMIYVNAENPLPDGSIIYFHSHGEQIEFHVGQG